MMPRPLCNRNLRPHGVWPRGAQHRPQFPGSFSILYLPSTGRSAYPSDPATLRDHKRRRFAALNDSLRAAIWNLLLPPRPIRSAGSSRVLLVTLSDEKGAAVLTIGPVSAVGSAGGAEGICGGGAAGCLGSPGGCGDAEGANSNPSLIWAAAATSAGTISSTTRLSTSRKRSTALRICSGVIAR